MSPKALVGILAGIILVVVCVYYSLPKSGKQVLEAEVTAMNGAQSWRITTVMGNAAGDKVTRTHAAICPDKEHIVEEGRGAASEYIRIGDDVYWRKGATPWKKGMPTNSYFFMNILTARPCLTNPKPAGKGEADGSEELRTWIQEDVKLARITKGEEKFENDDNCREWTVTREETRQLRYFRQEYVVCINEKDHLPRTMTATGGFVTHYDWNPALTIEAPDMNTAPSDPVAP
ncbi:MAG TPA: hypothetical protein VN025_14025 [Candidatus Dormibacteraeota bacterium]|jgi:hypothetical protein|nr:hypothetical protein [Candidatus Dormibacteraeota bacterium]